MSSEAEQVEDFVHRITHLRARQGRLAYSECTLVVDCWGLPGDVPDWALKAALSGEPASVWCPRVNPGLLASSVS